MKFIINGEIKTINFQQSNPNLALLINYLELNPKLIVVEFNGIIINRKKWADQQVKNGDKLEIVTIVGGGS